MKLLTSQKVIIRISAIIAMAEFLIMLLLQALPFATNPLRGAILDVILLSCISAPLIYIWVIKPFVNARDGALQTITQLAYTDPLTHLVNRRFFLNQLEIVIANIARHDRYGAIMLLDLDGFKQINDNNGHEAGDAILVAIAQRFTSALRTGDILGRMGGDEFVLLIEHLDAEQALAQSKASIIADKLISLASRPLEFKGSKLQVGASVGIYLLNGDQLNVDEVMSKADNAMYDAKRCGKGCTIIAQ